jgi:hypothetical protein
LRIGDVAVLGRQHLKQRTIVIDGEPVRRTVISIDSEKTGMRVELPPLPQLKETLGAGPTGDLAFIVPAWHAVEQRRAGHRVRGSGRRCGGGREISPRDAQGRSNPGGREMGRPRGNRRRFSAGQGGGWRRSTPKARPNPACGGGHRQARPCPDRK